MRFIKYSILLFIGAGLSACSFGLHKTVQATSIPITTSIAHVENSVDTLIAPFKEKLGKEMNEKVAVAKVDFINERINGNLGNLVSSLLLNEARKLQNDSMICVLNFGGLRSTLNRGDILLGDVYKLLPFDNYLVLVLLDEEGIEELKRWIIKTGGQPISGFHIKNGKLFKASMQELGNGPHWVVTSDYLLNGGDNANFFKRNIKVVQTGLLLRDVFLEGIRNQVLEDHREKWIIQD